MKSWNAL